MSFGSLHDVKEQVRQATDLVDLVSRSISLRRSGRLFLGLCPWHDDSRPSLQVNPERQSWKCWVCDIGGDVFSFVMKREGVDFPEALRILAERAGIALTSAQNRTEPGTPHDKPTLYRAVAWAEEQFHRCLLHAPEAEPARIYLAQRGIQGESIGRFHLGFSPDSWQWLLDRARTTPFSPPVLEAAGLVTRSQDGRRIYDRFRGRLIFSIRDTEHRPIAFGARILTRARGPTDGPKYINSPETRLFSKSLNLYALDLVRDSLSGDRGIVVVEGYTDVIMAHQQGVRNVVAALGTALGERHVRLLQRFAEHITLVLDGDEAGQRRTNEVLELFLAAQVDLRILTLPGGLDPCDFILQQGGAAFRARVDQAVDALEHKLRAVTIGLDVVHDPAGAHRALEAMLATIAQLPALTSGESGALKLREQQMLVRLAREFLVEESMLRLRLAELRRKRRKAPQLAPARPDTHALSPVELELFQILLVHGELAAVALREIQDSQWTGGLAQQLWQLYRRADQEQLGFDFETMMTVAEEAAVKHALAQLYDDARGKAELASEDAQDRLQGLFRDFQFHRERTVHRQRLAALKQQDHVEEEEVQVLQRIIENERNRQGISAPRDG